MSIALALALLALASPQDRTPPGKSAPSKPPPTPSSDTTVQSVVVDGSRTEVETSIDRRSYSVGKDLQAATGSLADVLRDIPSVQVDLQGNVSLRGDANVTVLVDGKPSSQFSGGNLAQALQSLPADQVERIEVITNPSAEFRADGKGGVINLIMKKAKGAGRTASLRLQAATGDRGVVAGNTGYNSDKLSTIADFSLRLDHQVPVTDNLQSLPNPATGVVDINEDLNTGDLTQELFNGHMGADYDLSSKTRFSAATHVFYARAQWPSSDTFVQDGDTGTPITGFARQTEQHAMQGNGDVSAILRHTWSEGRDLALIGTFYAMGYERDRLDMVTPTLPAGSMTADTFDRHTHTNTATFMADYETPLPGKAKLKLGYDFEHTHTQFEHAAASGAPGGLLTPDPSQSGSFLDNETHNQAYVTYQQAIGKLDVLLGLRGEVLQLALDQQTQNVHSDQDYGRLYPSLHLNYALADGRKLTASYARRVDRPPYSLLDPLPYNQSPGSVLRGNPALRPQDTDSFELGYEARKDASSFLATLYYRQTHDAFSYLYSVQPGGSLLEQAANAGRQTNGGLELVLANRLTSKLTYNLSADAYWTEVAAPNLGFTQTQRAVTGFGRANLNWQLTPKDFLQLNVFVNGKTLFPQGYVLPYASGNIGYRHTVNGKFSWMFVIQDPFDTAKSAQVVQSFGGKDRQLFSNNNRMASLTLVWNFSGKPQNTDFDFKPGGYGAASAP